MGNGGVIGAENRPSGSAANGVWGLQDLYNARLVNAWPSVVRLGEQGLVDFIYINAKGGITGDVYNYVPPYPVGDAGTGNFTASSATSQFTLTNHRLAVGDQLKFIEDGGVLPEPVVVGQVYYVESVVNANTFTISTSDGGLPLPLTTNGTDNTDRRVFKYPLANDPSGGLDVEVEIFHYDIASYPAGLTVTTTLRLGEDADKPERITAVVVDGNFSATTGTIGVTNNRDRLGFALLSRANIDVGSGSRILSPKWTMTNDADNFNKFRHWRLSDSVPFGSGYLLRGSDGGPAPSPTPTAGRGGAAFGFNRTTAGQTGASRQGGGGGSPVGAGGSPQPTGLGPMPGGTPGSSPNSVCIVAGVDVTVPPSGIISGRGGAGGNGGPLDPGFPPGFSPTGNGGHGAGGSTVVVFYSGALTNNGNITAAGGSGGSAGSSTFNVPGTPGVPGLAGNVITAPIPSDVVNL